MKLFLDTSVLLAGSGSNKGASHEVMRLSSKNHWMLVVTPYVIEEVLRNLPQLPLDASSFWEVFRNDLLIMGDVLTLDRPAIFSAAKDRPILFSALAWADVLLTLDRSDFSKAIGTAFYGLKILTPGQFLMQERAAGRLEQ